MRVKIIQQASGPGSYPIGTILDLPEDEARGLCSAGASQGTPFAIPVVEDRTETAVAPAKANVEVRAEVKAEAVPVVTEPEPVVEQPVKRGPGRPPGSTNKPRPQ